MTENAFLDKAARPTPAAVARALGPRAAYLDELIGHVQEPLIREWKHYGQKHGWAMKLLRGKRNLAFVIVCRGYFTLSFVFGDRAVRAVQESGLPAELVRELLDARRYVEGRGLRLLVKSRRVLEQAKVLIDVKRTT